MNKELYETWNVEKQTINSSKPSQFFVNNREIWFVKMGQNIGFEENGKANFLRPVLVLKKIGNLFFTVALTTNGKDEHVFYHKFKNIHLHNPRHINSSYAILSQVRVMDKRRFFEHAGVISNQEFKAVKQKLRTLLF